MLDSILLGFDAVSPRCRLCNYQQCMCTTRLFLLRGAEIVSSGGTLIISLKRCFAIYLAVRTVVLLSAANEHGSLSPLSSHAPQYCKAFLGNSDSCGQGGLLCMRWLEACLNASRSAVCLIMNKAQESRSEPLQKHSLRGAVSVLNFEKIFAHVWIML